MAPTCSHVQDVLSTVVRTRASWLEKWQTCDMTDAVRIMDACVDGVSAKRARLQQPWANSVWCVLLVVARKLTTSREMLLWMTPSEAPKALQASECSELLDPMRASCWISAQH